MSKRAAGARAGKGKNTAAPKDDIAAAAAAVLNGINAIGKSIQEGARQALSGGGAARPAQDGQRVVDQAAPAKASAQTNGSPAAAAALDDQHQNPSPGSDGLGDDPGSAGQDLPARPPRQTASAARDPVRNYGYVAAQQQQHVAKDQAGPSRAPHLPAPGEPTGSDPLPTRGSPGPSAGAGRQEQALGGPQQELDQQEAGVEDLDDAQEEAEQQEHGPRSGAAGAAAAAASAAAKGWRAVRGAVQPLYRFLTSALRSALHPHFGAPGTRSAAMAGGVAVAAVLLLLLLSMAGYRTAHTARRGVATVQEQVAQALRTLTDEHQGHAARLAAVAADLRQHVAVSLQQQGQLEQRVVELDARHSSLEAAVGDAATELQSVRAAVELGERLAATPPGLGGGSGAGSAAGGGSAGMDPAGGGSGDRASTDRVGKLAAEVQGSGGSSAPKNGVHSAARTSSTATGVTDGDSGTSSGSTGGNGAPFSTAPELRGLPPCHMLRTVAAAGPVLRSHVVRHSAVVGDSSPLMRLHAALSSVFPAPGPSGLHPLARHAMRPSALSPTCLPLELHPAAPGPSSTASASDAQTAWAEVEVQLEQPAAVAAISFRYPPYGAWDTLSRMQAVRLTLHEGPAPAASVDAGGGRGKGPRGGSQQQQPVQLTQRVVELGELQGMECQWREVPPAVGAGGAQGQVTGVQGGELAGPVSQVVHRITLHVGGAAGHPGHVCVPRVLVHGRL